MNKDAGVGKEVDEDMDKEYNKVDSTLVTQHSKSCLVQQISAGAASHELLGDCVTSRTVKGKEERVEKRGIQEIMF